MASLMPTGKQQYFSPSTGAPLAGGLLYTYVGGTSTPKDTWQDSAATIKNTNPVVLDAAGSALVFFSGNYKIVLCDPLGNVIYTVDNYVTDQSASLQASLAASSGSSLIGFIQNAASAVATAVQDVLNERISVTRFMTAAQRTDAANGTGSIDLTAAIQAAITAANTAKKRLYFPAGVYQFNPTAATEIDYGIEGESAYSTIIKVSGTYAGVVFRAVNSDALRELTIQSNGLTKTVGSIGLQVSNNPISSFTGHFEFSRVWVQGFEKNVDIENVFLVTFRSCRFESGTYGTYCSPDASGGNGYATTIAYEECYWYSNAVGPFHNSTAASSQSITIRGGAVEFSTGANYQAYFNNIIALNIFGLHIEGSNTIPAIVLNSITTLNVDGMLLWLAGQFQIAATGTNACLKNIQVGGTTAVLNCPGSITALTMENCNWPATGNTLLPHPAKFSMKNVNINGTFYQSFESNLQSYGSNNWLQMQATVVGGAGATDVFRFLDITGAVLAKNLSGTFNVVAVDQSTGANACQYQLVIQSNNSGTTNAALTHAYRTLRGTDPGASVTPFSLANDGAGGAVKLQFTKSASIANVVLNVQYSGLVV